MMQGSRAGDGTLSKNEIPHQMTKTTTDLQKYTYNIKFILLLLIQYKLYRKYKALSTF